MMTIRRVATIAVGAAAVGGAVGLTSGTSVVGLVPRDAHPNVATMATILAGTSLAGGAVMGALEHGSLGSRATTAAASTAVLLALSAGVLVGSIASGVTRTS